MPLVTTGRDIFLKDLDMATNLIPISLSYRKNLNVNIPTTFD